LGKHFLKGYGPISSVEVEMLPVAIAQLSLFFLCTESFVADPVRELQEQKKISDFLLQLDAKINIEQEKLQSLVSLKKG
jgi:hypothetical protein